MPVAKDVRLLDDDRVGLHDRVPGGLVALDAGDVGPAVELEAGVEAAAGEAPEDAVDALEVAVEAEGVEVGDVAPERVRRPGAAGVVLELEQARARDGPRAAGEDLPRPAAIGDEGRGRRRRAEDERVVALDVEDEVVDGAEGEPVEGLDGDGLEGDVAVEAAGEPGGAAASTEKRRTRRR